MKRTLKQLLELFWSKTEWRGTVYAHRWIYTKLVKNPGKHDVMHSCDNRACVRLDHLSDGTRKQNMVDAATKGRTERGVDRRNAKLTDNAVRKICRSYATGRYSQQELADQFGVHQVLISLVVRRRIWKHVEI